VNGDSIYNGANDDASGVAVVLELARHIARGPRPRRTLVVGLYGSEEIGGHGSAHFFEHPPVPLDHLAANLQFEMVGHADPRLAHALSLTGYERSDLGPALAHHGARLAADHDPALHLFERSDNYGLARRGVVAHTVMGQAVYPQYHRPDDDLQAIDLGFMAEATASLLGPMRWLLESDFVPRWRPGERP
jgi:Zn-dependent M28 family amino/carboxypeptidase